MICLLLLQACSYVREQAAPIVEPGPYDGLVDSALIGEAPLLSRQSVKDFYESRHYRRFWADSAGYRAIADSLIDKIHHADRFGLIATDYHEQEIETLLADTVPQTVSRVDILLTDAYLTLFHHLRHGRLNPATLQREDLSSVSDSAAILSLQNTAHGPVGALRLPEPDNEQYRQLKAKLTAFQVLGKTDSLQRQRAEKIALNMERWRWEDEWPHRYVVVNIPAFQLRAVENDSVWLRSKVIVGKRETPTPVMESVIRSFTIYPYWHVPRSISTKELLPHLQADAAYLERNNFQVLDRTGTVIDADTIHWQIYNADFFPFVLRQREGSENSMGVIKFHFSNPYGVYLHDTNSKRLFGQGRRDFSHGCVRVEKAVALAHYLVHDDDIYVSPEDLDQYLSLQHRLEIKLRKPIPVKLVYFTCEVQDGTTHFYEDIYKKDSLMSRALYPSPKAELALK